MKELSRENKHLISVVIPVYNEEGSVDALHRELVESLGKIGDPFEIIFVDDGSSDETLSRLRKLTPARVVSLRRNFGQTAAIDAGIEASIGEIIVTLDGDGQNDPKDISLLLSKLREGYDTVSGWRRFRRDPFSKRMISRGANLLRKIFVRDGIRDSGCGLKAYKRECFENFELYGEIHRFIPGLLAARGWKIGEVEVSHRHRKSGRTKYGLGRTLKGFLDMIGVSFWRTYAARPLHLFGGIGLAFFSIGSLLVATLFFLRLFDLLSLRNSVWPLAGFFLMLAGIQLFISGILADIAIKNYHRSRSSKPYSVREITENSK